MNTKSLIKAINMGEGEVLTLEKAGDRMEFEALPILSFRGLAANCDCHGSGGDCSCHGAGANCWAKMG